MRFLKTLAASAAIGMAGMLAAADNASASNCGTDFQHAYENGVSDGRVDGAHQRSNDPSRHRPAIFKNVDRGGDRAECYTEGYNNGYQNAYADAKKGGGKHADHGGAPTKGSNERAYYDDGCHEGTSDAKASMSMAYDRHANDYDSRFEPYYKQGYEKCWRHHR